MVKVSIMVGCHLGAKCTFGVFLQFYQKVHIQEMGLINVLVLGVNWHIFKTHLAKVHQKWVSPIMTLGGALLAFSKHCWSYIWISC